MKHSASPETAAGPRDTVAALARCPVFSPLDETDLMQMAEQARVRPHRRSEYVWRQGDVADSVLLVLKGRLKAWIGDHGSRGWLRGVVRRGDVWGLSAAIDDGPRLCTLQALEASVVVHVDAGAVRDALDRRHGFALHVASLVGKELRRMIGRCEKLALHTPLERLADYLLEHSDANGQVHLRETQGQIAAQIGTVREVVGRSFRRLEGDGLVARRGRDVQVLDRPTLERLVGHGASA